ncbi:MAG TPA: cytochrome-c oxidase, cbb3-type subunit II, partial [Polyangiaceae bacterium]|nr:cytochrome-c oxidase, cbb3-type subunit II [Polyangiaceae bacterium]
VLKFFAAGVTFYGMSTFQGPLLSIRSVNALGHYTDWIIGHVHGGTLGWNGLMAAGMFYWLVPRLYGTKLYSRAAANLHFYVGTIGILIYMVAMWASGITQGLMWQAETEGGGLLYPNFIETVDAIRPMYWARLVGGTAYFLGFCLQAWNLLMTIKGNEPVETSIEVVVEDTEDEGSWKAVVLSKPVIGTVIAGVLVAGMAIANSVVSTVLVVAALAVAIGTALAVQAANAGSDGPNWHRLLEGRALLFTVFTTVAILIGGIAELIPTIVLGAHERTTSAMEPYTALELHGRDVYIQEGCYTCHSQMIRPFTWENARYPGGVSNAADSVWDHPFQWGSKRTGPDLARESAMNRGPVWHYNHMLDPRSTSEGSIMPFYTHLREDPVDFDMTQSKLGVMQMLGVPYDNAAVLGGEADAHAQARSIAAALASDVELDGLPDGVDIPLEDSQLVALIAYLERLGRNESAWVQASSESTEDSDD